MISIRRTSPLFKRTLNNSLGDKIDDEEDIDTIFNYVIKLFFVL